LSVLYLVSSLNIFSSQYIDTGLAVLGLVLLGAVHLFARAEWRNGHS